MKRHASLNHAYRLVWSRVLHAWIAVAETARGRGKCTGRQRIAATLALITLTPMAQAVPVGGQVVTGSGSITQSGASTTIQQDSQQLSLNWQGFNIAPGETVNFQQPSASAIAVNRIYDTNGTQILGRLNANGQVYLINPNGILFGQGALVNVGGLVASTLDLDDSSLSGSTRTFRGNGTGRIINQGSITATDGGYVALLGNSVSNQGVITAKLGTVALGAGSAATLSFNGNRLVHMQVDQSVLDSLAENRQLIQADGGQVLMTAGAKDALLASVVNNSGIIEARTVENHDGTIILLGGMAAGQVNVGGTLDASAPTGGNGGFIETSAAHVNVVDDAIVTTLAPQGHNGTWLIDPYDFTVAATGGNITGASLSSLLNSNSITIHTATTAPNTATDLYGNTGANGDIFINDAINWNGATTLTLDAFRNISINESITATNATGKLALNYGQGFLVNSGFSATYTVNAPVSLQAGANFSTRLGSDGVVKNYTVITSLGEAGSVTATDLQGMNGNLAGNYALGSDINATATSAWNAGAGFLPIWDLSTYFTGSFEGLGHTIGNLTITRPTTYFVGLFGITAAGSDIRNVGLVGGSVVGGQKFTGGLVGNNNGTVSNSYATGDVSGVGYVGGLLGFNSGTVSNSYATGKVIGGAFVGGLVGQNSGTVSNSYATGSVSGTIGSSSRNFGGLVGFNLGTVINSYATGDVSGGDYVGGLIGRDSHGSVTNSYATGSVSGSTQLGGLVGYSFSGTVTNSYWNTETSGLATSAGGTGLTTAQMRTASNFAGFDFTNTWVMVDVDGSLNNAGGALGTTFPMLRSEYSASIHNAHQLQLMAMAPDARYTLSANIDVAATGTSKDVWGSAGFAPVGNGTNQFTGSFDGLSHTISNLFISRPTTDYVGLFGYAGTGSTIENVGLLGGSVSGQTDVGELLGISKGTVSNSYATGSVSGTGNYVGGLVGENNGTVTNSYAMGGVNGSGDYTGGLVGGNLGAFISNSYATGDVIATGSYVGGLVGSNWTGSIDISYATGSVNGAVAVGGLAGYNSVGTVSNSYATGAVVATGNQVGGLVGYGGAISNSYAMGSVSSPGNYVGGLVGESDSTVTNSYAMGSVNSTGDYTGGLVGRNLGAFISNSYATGSVIATGSYVGGLVGSNYTGSINNSYATGSVSGAVDVGGLVGYNSDGTVSNSFWDSDINVTGIGVGSMNGATGLSTSHMHQQSNFSGWDFATTWIGYDGHTSPLLRPFMSPLTVTANNVSKTYDGLAYVGASGVTYSSTPNANLLGTLSYSSGTNVGSYAITPGGLYSNQQGYIIDYVNGTLTVNPANLTLSSSNVSKTYDGSLAAAGSAVVTGGTLYGTDSLSGGSFAFTDKNVGLGNKTVTISGVSINDGNGGGNYNVSYVNNTSSTITPAPLTYTAAPVSFFAGQTPSGLSGTVSGFMIGDTLEGSTIGTLVWTTTAGAASQPGHYPITGNGLTSQNYVFAQATGNAAALTLTAAMPSSPATLSQPVRNATAQLQTEMLSPRMSDLASSSSDVLCTTQPQSAVSGAAGGANIPAPEFDAVAMMNTAMEIVGGRTGPRFQILNGGVKLPDNLINLNY